MPPQGRGMFALGSIHAVLVLQCWLGLACWIVPSAVNGKET